MINSSAEGKKEKIADNNIKLSRSTFPYLRRGAGTRLMVTIMFVIFFGGKVLMAQANFGSLLAPDNSATLQISGNKGMLVPLVTTAQRDAIGNPAKGLQIFNIDNSRLEVNTGMSSVPNWSPFGYSTLLVTQLINSTLLGYVPSSTATATGVTATAIINAPSNNAVCTKRGTTNFGTHSYAIYSTPSTITITWYDAYTMAKTMGGYLATYTNYPEWLNTYNNLLLPYAIFDTQECWIGMAKLGWRAGPALSQDVINWITGESSSYDYSGNGGAAYPYFSAIWSYSNFSNNEPNNKNGLEGFMTTSFKSIIGRSSNGVGAPGTPHAWNDITANNPTPGQYSGQGFIVEFGQQ